jgi:hypothetical protein
MDGVAIIRALLTADDALLALVPDDRVAAGALPLGTPLDALSIEMVSTADRNIIAPGANRRVTERVQVTALAATYPRLKAVLAAAKKAAADYVGSAAGVVDVTVHTAGGGPEFMNRDASIHMGTQDFLVGFTEAR